MDKGLILERYYAQLAEGVQRFARPVRPERPMSAPDADKEPVRGAPATPVFTTTAKVASVGSPCSRCPRISAEGSAAAVPARVAQPQPWVRREVFALADVPSPDESEGLPFTSEKAPSQVLGRLLDRLAAARDAHRSFAVKCASRKGCGFEAVSCARDALAPELAVVSPSCLLCFGARAAQGASLALRSLGVPAEDCDLLPADDVRVVAPWGAVRVLVLPSALELDRYPEWRAGVWERLAFLR